jgi:hypothetical protein
MRFDHNLSVLLASFAVGMVAACSGDTEPSDPGSVDAAHDARNGAEAGDAGLDPFIEPRDIGVDGANEASADVTIDQVEAATDASADLAIGDATDAPTDMPVAPDTNANDANADAPDAAGATDAPGPTNPETSVVADADAADPGDAYPVDAHTADAPDPSTADADAGATDADPTDVQTTDANADLRTPGAADATRDAVDESADGEPPNVIFVTSISYPSDLGGLAGADEKCRQRAQAAGLRGTFVALLSTSTVNAKSRLGTARGWVRTDGKPFADRQQDLFSTSPTAIDSARTYYPPNLDEFGNALPAGITVSSGTRYDGILDPQGGSCNDWTSTAAMSKTIGRPTDGAHGYIFYGWSSCPYSANLTCIEISRTSRVDPPSPPQIRRAAFVSAGYFYPSNGLASADAICTSEAAAASLPGTYRAFLATTQASAMSRFDVGGAPWVRVDGVVLAATASDFAAGNWLAPLNVTARSAYIGNFAVWVGAPGPSALGISNCNDWKPTDPSTQAATTTIAYWGSTSWWIEQPCDWLYGRVYCLQQ